MLDSRLQIAQVIQPSLQIIYNRRLCDFGRTASVRKQFFFQGLLEPVELRRSLLPLDVLANAVSLLGLEHLLLSSLRSTPTLRIARF